MTQKEEHVLACVLETTWGCLYWQGALGSKGNAQQLKGEAAAMLEAMKELEQRGFTNVVFETDSKNVADAIHFMQFTHKTSNNVYFGF
jgi:ribonuclease HI